MAKTIAFITFLLGANAAVTGHLKTLTDGDDHWTDSTTSAGVRKFRPNGFIHGLRGADAILGVKGADKLYGSQGADRLRGGPGSDTLRGGLDDDRLFGGAGSDKLYGSEGADKLSGAAGRDLLDGDAVNDSKGGSDVLHGGLGADALYGGFGNDLLYPDGVSSVLSYSDFVAPGPGNDTIVLPVSTNPSITKISISDFYIVTDFATYSMTTIRNFNVARDYICLLVNNSITSILRSQITASGEYIYATINGVTRPVIHIEGVSNVADYVAPNGGGRIDFVLTSPACT